MINNMRYNVVQYRTKLGESCPFILTKNFFGKLTATFVQLLRLHQIATFQKWF